MDARARLGLLRTFQLTRSLMSLTVEEALRLGASNPRARQFDGAATSSSIAERFGLDRVRHHLVGTLPYGTQKVLNMCFIMSSRPTVVVLDEPFAGVIPSDVSLLSEVIRQFRTDGAAVAVIEHDMGALMPLSDSVLVLDAGAVVMQGASEEVLADDRVQSIYLGHRGGARFGQASS
jgi:branched-chain amino acid transport system ATP-binding protein